MPQRTPKKILRSKKGSHKVSKVMGEFESGTLKSGSGKKVTSKKQAFAIAASEAESAVKGKKSKRRRIVLD